MGKIVLINPILVTQKNDFWGSGIPYMPHILAYTAGLLKQHKFECRVIDAFGLNAEKITKHGNFYWQGLEIDEVVDLVDEDTDSIFIYSSAITNAEFNLELIKRVKSKRPGIRVVLLGNTQAVTSFDVAVLARRFIDQGVDIIVYNNIEKTVLNLAKRWLGTRENIIYQKGKKLIKMPMSNKIGDTEEVIFPAWELFPLKSYWRLGYSHGPMQGRYLPLLTSYGCPFRCNFCVNPGINKSRWQAKSAKLVFDEIKHLVERFNVREFHLEDLDPTIDKERVRDLSRLIIKNRLKIRWKIVSGTKVETINEETLLAMRKSGCNYISISPETGSKRVLKLMNKSFDYKHADWFIKRCRQIGIKTQACFVIGFPGENEKDQQKTQDYIFSITRLGISEIAIFIATPLPGSKIFKEMAGYLELSDLTFTPKWRKDYGVLEKFRSELYKKFIWWKFCYHPAEVIRQGINFLNKNFETKMEMMPYRMIKFNFLLMRNRV